MDTKGHCFPKSIIIQAVYFKLRFSLSYRDVEEIMRIRGVEVDHATIQRWVYKFMPEIEIQIRKRKKVVGKRWRMDETYIKVKGVWRYLYRAVDKNGHTIDFLLTKRRQRLSAHSFLIKATENNGTPELINVEQDHRNVKRRIATNTGFKDFESAQRTLAGIEIVHMIKKDQLNTQERSMFKSFYSLAALNRV